MLTARVNLKKVIGELEALPRYIEAARRDALQEIGEALVKNIQAGAPVETGSYKNSWKIKRVDSKEVVVWTPKRQLFVILEFQGSKPHEIRPKKAKVLRWPIKKNKIVQRGAAPSPALPSGGNQQYAYAMRVWHPGFKPIRHARPALRHVQKQAAKIALKVYARHAAKAPAGPIPPGDPPSPPGAIMGNAAKKAGAPPSYKISVRRTVTRKTGRKRLSRKRVGRTKVDR